MPFYDHECSACGHIWEDFYSAVKDPPDTCPKCGVRGKTKRLLPDNISVRVALTGQELKTKIAEDRRKIKQKVKTDENFRANIAGEDRYNSAETYRSELNKNLKNM